ncbi:toxin-antitoxin system HicB family antitoxin, partial [Candidatus Poribacteria bacterium]|nr:toxin-antitoxin system HicB family antitoxin [Candidatus Poribacteria bacterium]
RQVTLAYTVQAIPENTVEQQRAQFKELLQNLGPASDAEIKNRLAEREIVEPEAELSPDVVARLQKRMTGEWSSASK